MDRLSENAPLYTPGSLTYNDYLTLPNNGVRYEILNGFLVQEPAPEPHHQRVVFHLARILNDYFSTVDPGGEVFIAPFDLKLSLNSIVQPDVIYIPGDRKTKDEDLLETLPELVIEVLSPSTKARDRVRKMELYRKRGISHYWLVDPDGVIEALHLQGEHYSIAAAAWAEQKFLHPKFPNLTIDIGTVCQRPE